jgi:hypothetical protein
VALAASVQIASADTLLLKSGGSLDGELRRRPADGAKGADAAFVVQVDEGILVRIAASEVGRVIETSKAEQEYQKWLPKMPDTADGHAKMAKWCEEHQLTIQKDLHWQQVLRHDADHPEARRALGYNRIRGEWSRPEDFMTKQGYQRYKGGWWLPQQVKAVQQQEEIEIAEKKWRRDIRIWRDWLNGRRRGEGMARLRAIDDPLADAGLAYWLAEEPDAAIRELYVDLLTRLATPIAANALIEAAIHDEDLEVRLRCVDRLRDLGAKQAVAAWSGALRSPNNRVVNRAGVALGRLGDRSAVRPLIDALVTRHETVVQPSANIQPTFSSGPNVSGGGLSIGGGPRKVVRQLENKGVLEALVALTEHNYRYSQADWNNWYIQQRALPDGVSLRRD